jgi:hypothetical protein
MGAHVATYEELSTLLVEIESCLNSRPLCTLSDDPFIQTYLSPGHLLTGEPLTQIPSLTILMSNATDFPDGKPTNNAFNNSGRAGHPTTSRACSSANDGRGHPQSTIGDHVLVKEDNPLPLHWPAAVTRATLGRRQCPRGHS